MNDLTKGKPGKLIIKFALPLMVGNMFQLFYSFADVWIIGKFLGENSLAAVGATSTLNDFIVGFLIGLTNGFAVITARYFGEGNEKQLRKSVIHSIFYGLIISAVLTVASLVFLPQILGMLNIPPEHLAQSMEYSVVTLAGMTVMMLYNVAASTLRAMGDSINPLIFLIISAFLNVFLDILFITVFKTGVAGAAYATVISQGISVIMCIVYVIKKYPVLRFRKQDIHIEKKLSAEILSCGISMGLMNSLVALGTVVLQTAINKLGSSIIVAHTAARKLTNLFMSPFGVIGMTMASYCAQNYGAGKYSRIKEGIKKALVFCAGWSVLMIIVSYTLSPVMIKLITSTNDRSVINNGSLYLKIDSILYVVTSVIVVLRNSLQALGNHKVPVFSSFIELVGKIVFALLLTPVMGYMGIIITEPVVWVLMVIPLIVAYISNPVIKNISEIKNSP